MVGVVQLEGDEEKSKYAFSAVIITICSRSDMLFQWCDNQEQYKCFFLMVVSFIHPHK
jgi:hypothetical protein